MIKVKQLANNQFIINDHENITFQSYDSIIVSIPANQSGKYPTLLDKTYWNYSKTTSKYRNKFLNETTKETQAKIYSGEYVLTDLNGA